MDKKSINLILFLCFCGDVGKLYFFCEKSVENHVVRGLFSINKKLNIFLSKKNLGHDWYEGMRWEWNEHSHLISCTHAWYGT